MSALGHKRTFCNAIVMSALLPISTEKADIAAQGAMTISMAFIAPGLVKAAVEGRLPRGIGVAALRDMPAEWSLQFKRLGLAQN